MCKKNKFIAFFCLAHRQREKNALWMALSALNNLSFYSVTSLP